MHTKNTFNEDDTGDVFLEQFIKWAREIDKKKKKEVSFHKTHIESNLKLLNDPLSKIDLEKHLLKNEDKASRFERLDILMYQLDSFYKLNKNKESTFNKTTLNLLENILEKLSIEYPDNKYFIFSGGIKFPDTTNGDNSEPILNFLKCLLDNIINKNIDLHKYERIKCNIDKWTPNDFIEYYKNKNEDEDEDDFKKYFKEFITEIKHFNKIKNKKIEECIYDSIKKHFLQYGQKKFLKLRFFDFYQEALTQGTTTDAADPIEDDNMLFFKDTF